MYQAPSARPQLLESSLYEYRFVAADGGGLELHLGRGFKRLHSDLNRGRALELLRSVTVIHGDWVARAGEDYALLERVAGDLVVLDQLSRNAPATVTVFDRLQHVDGSLHVAGSGIIAPVLTKVRRSLQVNASIIAPELRFVGHDLRIVLAVPEQQTGDLTKLSVVGGSLLIASRQPCPPDLALSSLIAVGGTVSAPRGWLMDSLVSGVGRLSAEQIRHRLEADSVQRRAVLDDADLPITNMLDSDRGLGL